MNAAGSESVGVGVVGANSFVANAAVIPAIVNAHNAHLAATASRSRAVPDRWASTDVGSYEAVLEHPDVDAVYIPLPNGMHREWTEHAAAAGKHVLCEKPLASDTTTARAMADACAGADVLLAEAWMTPFSTRYRHVLDRVHRGDVGDVISVDGAFSFTIGPESSDNYRWDRDQGGGALLDVGIYCLGAAVELFGPRAAGIDATQRLRRGVDASTSANLVWPDGPRCSLTCSFVDDDVQQLSITGSQGSFVIETEAFTGGPDQTAYVHALESSVDQAADAPERTPASVVDIEANDPYQAMIEAFADAVAGRSEWPRPVERSIEMLELIERIRDAAAT